MQKKNIGLLIILVSALFNVMAVVTFSGGNESGMGAMWLCLGSALLCLGTALSRKKEEEEKKD